jgi:hypothetical protein
VSEYQKTSPEEISESVRNNAPAELLAERRWLLWKEVSQPGKPKPRRVPFYVDGAQRGGRLDVAEDLDRLATFDAAVKAFHAGNYTGLGFAVTGEGIAAFDLDDCLDLDSVLLTDSKKGELAMKLEMRGAYIEVSPSGRGLRIFGRSSIVKAYSKDGLEYWGRGRYLTVTGRVWANPRGWTSIEDERALLGPSEAAVDLPTTDEDDEGGAWLTTKDRKRLQAAMAAVDAEAYETWVQFGLALKPYGRAGFELWDQWAQGSKKYPGLEESKRKWDEDFDARSEIGIGSIIYAAKEAGWDEEVPSEVEEHLTGVVFDEEGSDYDLKITAPEFILDGFMPRGFSLVAGTHGAGKTTNLLPLMACVAHLAPECWGFRPELRRKVVWITEAVEQSFNALKVVLRQDGADRAEAKLWFRIAPANRAHPEQWAKALAKTRARLTYDYHGHVVEPVFVFDTAAANLALENENDNSEVSNAVATLRQALPGANLIVVGHVSKAAGSEENLAFRGASAWEADAEATYALFYSAPLDQRILAPKKVRFPLLYDEIHFSTVTATNPFDYPWGTTVSAKAVAGVPEKGSVAERRAAVAQAREQSTEDFNQEQARMAVEERRETILDLVRRSLDPAAHPDGVSPYSKTTLARAMSGGFGKNAQAVAALVDNGELIEVAGRLPTGRRSTMLFLSGVDISVVRLADGFEVI